MNFSEFMKDLDPKGVLTQKKMDVLKRCWNAGVQFQKDKDGVVDAVIMPVVRETVKYFNKVIGKNVKACGGNVDLIKILTNKNYGLEDFKNVIDYCNSWKGSQYENHLKFHVLFGSAKKVAKYLSCHEDWYAEQAVRVPCSELKVQDDSDKATDAYYAQF